MNSESRHDPDADAQPGVRASLKVLGEKLTAAGMPEHVGEQAVKGVGRHRGSVCASRTTNLSCGDRPVSATKHPPDDKRASPRASACSTRAGAVRSRCAPARSSRSSNVVVVPSMVVCDSWIDDGRGRRFRMSPRHTGFGSRSTGRRTSPPKASRSCRVSIRASCQRERGDGDPHGRARAGRGRKPGQVPCPSTIVLSVAQP